MLGIEINGEFLDLEEVGFTIELNNPIFAEEVTDGSGSFDLSIPATERNNRIFEHINQVASTKRFSKIPCKIYLSNQFWKDAILVIDKAEVFNSYSVRFDTDIPLLQSTLQNTMIDAFDYGTYKFPTGKYATIKVIDPATWGMASCAIEVKGHNYPGGIEYFQPNYYYVGLTLHYYTAEYVAEQLCNAINAVSDRDYNATFNSSGVIQLIPVNIDYASECRVGIRSLGYYYCPIVIYFNDAYNQLQTDLYNYNLYCKNIADTITNQMLVTFTPNQDIVYPVIYNPEFYKENEAYQQYLNNYLFGSGYYYNEYDEVTNPIATQYTIVPQIKLAKIIEAIKTMPGIIFEGGFFDDISILDYYYVYNNYSLDKVIYLDFPTLEQRLNIWADEIVIANHIPKISVLETIKALAQAFGYRVFYQGNTISLKSLDSIINSSSYRDDTFKALPSVPITNAQIEGISLKYASGDDSFAEQLDTSTYNYLGELVSFPTTPNYNDLFLFTGDQLYYAYKGQIVLDGTLAEVSVGDWEVVGNNYKEAYNYGSAPYDQKQLLIPALTEKYEAGGFGVQISQPGSSNFLNQGIKKVDKLYLMYMPTAALIPKARKVDMNDLFTYQQAWADWQISSKQVSRKINFNVLDLLNFDFTQKRRINDTEYLYKTVRFQTKGKQISPADVIMYPDLR